LIRIQLFHTRVTGVESDGAFDTLSLDLIDSVTVNSFQEVYENRIYEVTVEGTTAGSQPTYDTTIGNSTKDGFVAATETLTLAGNAANTETVTIGAQVYTFNTALGGADSILIGASASDSLDNLIAAINGDAGEGTLYGTGTAVNTDVSAVAGGGDTMDVTALVSGTAANSVDTLETLATGGSEWGGITLSGGVDGAELTARDSFTRDGVVAAVTSNFTMEVVFSDARAVDDWLNGGALIFESGANSGIVREISDFVALGQVLTLFLPEPFTPFAGQKVRVYTGCDKRRETCKVRFVNVINFQGEPDVPGTDEIGKVGNAAIS